MILELPIATRIEKWKADFEILVNDIEKLLVEMDNMDKIKLVSCTIITENPLLFSEEEIAAIRAGNSVSDVFHLLQGHWRWDSHHLLSTLIQLNESQDSLTKLKNFEDEIENTIKLNEFSQRFQSMHRDPPPGYTKMGAILEKEYSEYTLKECKELDRHLASALGSTTLRPPFYEHYESNSIEVTWHIPKESVKGLLSKAYQAKELFQLLSISFFEIDEVVILKKKLSYSPDVCMHIANHVHVES